MKLLETWDIDNIHKNYKELMKNIKWKGFKLSPPADDDKKGYILMEFNSGLEKESTKILIYRHRIQITYNNWKDLLLALVISNLLLKEDEKSPVSLILKNFKETGSLPQPLVRSSFEILRDQYLDLTEGKLSGDIKKYAKEILETSLILMLEEVINVNDEEDQK
ncbi:hypothetical protein CW705_04015 [Candidatus Bathyarchaeota archaeon]|nr:MAG: hypothetical protein CW705_04015 [Candidatus Bathyarchaeota archaeon]